MKYNTRHPVVAAPKQPRGIVKIVEERCKGCEFCVEFCPKDVLELSTKFNTKGYHFPQVKTPDSCVNCQLCYYLCPEFAIFVTESTNSKGMDSHNKRNHQTKPISVVAER